MAAPKQEVGDKREHHPFSNEALSHPAANKPQTAEVLGERDGNRMGEEDTTAGAMWPMAEERQGAAFDNFLFAMSLSTCLFSRYPLLFYFRYEVLQVNCSIQGTRQSRAMTNFGKV